LMLEDSLTLSGVWSAVGAYFRLSTAGRRLEPCREHFTFPGGTLNFFEVLRDEWYSSLRGAEAMSACLYAAAFSATARDLPATTSRMIYLWENQGWEQSLLCAWTHTHP